MNPNQQQSDQQSEALNIKEFPGKIPAILTAVGTPLKFFGLAAILCLPVFSVAAAKVSTQFSYDAFIYTLHTYLAVVGMFTLVSLFSPRSLYHPKELEGINSYTQPPKYNPLIPCLIALTALAMYLAYQAFVVYGVGSHKVAGGAGETNSAPTTAIRSP